MEKEKLTDVPLHQIQIKDAFWDKYIRLVKDVILPYQWNTLNDNVKDAAPSHCIKNFKIAAGEAEGDFEGAVFQDTDVAKWLEAVAFTLDSSGRDEKLEKLADETIDLIGKAQCEDGYLNTYFTIKEPDRRWTNLKEGHELYTAGHMIEAAAKLYCQPQVNCQMQIHDIDGHTVLEVIVPPGTTKPYYAKDQTNKCWAYIRIKDENILATPVHLKVWQQEGTPKGSFLHYTEQERLLLDYLTTHPAITLNQYCRLARIPRIKAENTLAKFIRFELIEPIFENHRFYFRGCT